MLSRLQTIISMIRSDPLNGILYLLCFTAAILVSLILHEIAHGYVAYRCGDPTAKMMGRLSLNPAKHLDPVGTVCMVIFGIGWAKPVPVNPRNYRHYRRDDILVSVAGIVMNLILFLLTTALVVAIQRHVTYSTVMYYIYLFLYLMSSLNLSLALFNLLPIPPLDGYHLLNDIIFRGRIQMTRQQFQIMQFVLIAICLTGVLSNLLSTVHTAIFNWAVQLMYTILP